MEWPISLGEKIKLLEKSTEKQLLYLQGILSNILPSWTMGSPGHLAFAPTGGCCTIKKIQQ
jgi:hypothetical protein